MTINELVESFNITLDNALILASMSIFVIVAIRIFDALFRGIYYIMVDITKGIRKISEKRKNAEIVKKESNNG